MNKFVATGMAAALSMAVALPVFAEESSSSSMSSSAMTTTSSSSSSSSNKMMKAKEKMNRGNAGMKVKGNVTIDTACAKTAVEKRENAIIAAEDASSASMKTALTTRLTALSAAWGQTDTAAREAALKAAHSAFKGSWKTTSTTLRTARKAAWSTFKTDAKACKISIPSVEASAETSDSQM